MATRTITTDDIDGVTEATQIGVEVALGDRKVRLDLSGENHDRLVEFLEPYLAAGTPVAKRGRPKKDAAQEHARPA